MKRIVAFLLSICISFSALAQLNQYSYVYIEGDKETPFYVKLEGTMMPRLGKNYAIISNLDKGYTKIEVLFEQNKYPAYTFYVNVPDNAARSLQLRKLDDGKFALYDLIDGHYILSGNKKEDNIDKLLAQLNSTSKTPAVIAKPATEELPKISAKPNSDNTKSVQEKSKASTKNNATVAKTKKDNNSLYESDEDPILEGEKPPKQRKQFIDNVSINGDDETNAVPPNTDCKTAISEEEFGNYLIRIKDRSDDDAKLKYISKQKRSCFTTEQIRQIALQINSQSGRMQVVQDLYSQVSDPVNYKSLNSIFATDFLKKKFIEFL